MLELPRFLFKCIDPNQPTPKPIYMKIFHCICRQIHLQLLILMMLFSVVSSNSNAQQPSIAQSWSEVLLFALENDFARPTIQSRYLFHSGIAMYDSWAVYDSTANTYLLGNTVGTYSSSFDGIAIASNPETIRAAREETMSFAMSRLLQHYFLASPGFFNVSMEVQNFMSARNYDLYNISVDYQNGGAAELGNYIAQEIINFGSLDGSSEANGYMNQLYVPQNDTLFPAESGNPQMTYPNKWQPLTIVDYDINFNPIYLTAPYLTAEWGNVQPFALSEENLETFEVDGNLWNVYHNPGAPPLLDTTEQVGLESPLKWGTLMTSVWQSHHDPDLETMWDVSPGAMGNIQSYPETWEDYPEFYDFFEGGDNSTGHPLNPFNAEPYETNLVQRGEYTRSLSEFWSESYNYRSVPAKWLAISNEKVLNHPDFERNWMGEELMDTLTYDVKFYLTLGGVLHDAAITAWSIKTYYESPRPISTIRYMAERGQCSDTTLANYHPAGLPLLEGFVEVVLPGDSLAGEGLEHVGKIKLKSWRGPDYVDFAGSYWDPQNSAGVGWILAEDWFPFQAQFFVSPPYATYVSGHTLFSSAAATMLEQVTGDSFFPGGLAQFEIEEGSFPYVEYGPEESVVLQYATYRDMADQCGLSRIWAGVNTPFADIPARLIGQTVGGDAVSFANAIFENDVLTSVPAILNAPDLTVFPNPAAKGEIVNIQTNETLNKVVISIANSTGKVVYRKGNVLMEKGIHAIQVADLNSGLYILHLQSTECSRTVRIVVR